MNGIGMSHKLYRKTFLATIWLTLAVKLAALQAAKSTNEVARLPKTSYPLLYDIHLKTSIHRGDSNYTGSSNITIKVTERTAQLVLHADVTVEEVFMTDLTNGLSREKLNFELNKENQFLILRRLSSAGRVKYFEKDQFVRLDFKFRGVLNEDGFGFSSFTYEDFNGREVMGAFSFFQAPGARLVFPCYDEPALKAKFTLHLTHGPHITALSSMPQNGELVKHADGMVTTNFKESNVMSTYLLAFVLSNFRSTHLESDGLHFRLFSPDGKDEYNVLSNQAYALKKMEELFNVPHVFQKLDTVLLAGMDNDMENWGLIYHGFGNFTFAAHQWFTDDAYIKWLILHEICHTWFGNLVTTEWWPHLWLHEGFATYYAYLLADLKWTSERHLERMRVTDCMRQLMNSEKGVMSTMHIDRELSDIFSSIAYFKAGCVIQMFEHAFGPQVFRDGVSMYIKDNYFSTVTEDDLFDGIQQAKLIEGNSTSVPWSYSVHEIMKSWTHNAVFPIITVERDYTKCNSSVIKLRDISRAKLTFWIPLTFATASNPNFENTKVDFFMHTKEVTIDLKSLNITLKPDDWLIVNKQAIGYYTVIYDDRNMELLNRTLHESRNSISPLNRAAIYANIGKTKVIELHREEIEISVLDLELIRSLRHEDDASVWLAATMRFNALPIYTERQYKLLRSYLKEIIEPNYERYNARARSLSGAIEPIMFKELQGLARNLNIQTALNDQALSAAYLSTLRKNQDEDEGIGYQLLCRAVQNVSELNFEYLTKKYSKTEEECKYWFGLQCTQSEKAHLIYADYFYENFADCTCIVRSFSHFLAEESTVSWHKAFKAHANALKSNASCIEHMFNYIDRNVENFPEENLLKLEDEFMHIEKIRNRNKSSRQPPRPKDEAGKWLEKWEAKENEI